MIEDNSNINDTGIPGLSDEMLAAYEKEIEIAYQNMLQFVAKYKNYSRTEKDSNYKLFVIAEGHIKWYENYQQMDGNERRRTLIKILQSVLAGKPRRS